MAQYQNEVEQFTESGLTVFIMSDPEPQNPRKDWDNAGTMVCFNGKYDLGDTHDFLLAQDFGEWWQNNGEGGCMLPLYLYDHSGLTMRTTPFDCPWDSGIVGFIYMTRETIEKEGIADPECVLKAEVETYDQYLRGDVYCFSVEDNGHVVDSCCGFFGIDHCREEARHSAKCVVQP